MATIRAKFKLNEEQRFEGLASRRYKFGTVYSNAPDSENKAFWDATPQGSIEMTVTNKDAWPFFELGREYYLDFTPAPEAT